MPIIKVQLCESRIRKCLANRFETLSREKHFQRFDRRFVYRNLIFSQILAGNNTFFHLPKWSNPIDYTLILKANRKISPLKVYCILKGYSTISRENYRCSIDLAGYETIRVPSQEILRRYNWKTLPRNEILLSDQKPVVRVLWNADDFAQLHFAIFSIIFLGKCLKNSFPSEHVPLFCQLNE